MSPSFSFQDLLPNLQAMFYRFIKSTNLFLYSVGSRYHLVSSQPMQRIGHKEGWTPFQKSTFVIPFITLT